MVSEGERELLWSHLEVGVVNLEPVTLEEEEKV
jgi:hypothetical protein